MAMLAEPRRRQKWGLNPRGTLWSDDQNKFGQKLMEKMGWNKGEGLGKEGQGITEHIKVNHKDNTKGVGYKGKDDEWVKHVDAFENVLAALNSENNSASNSPNNSANNSPNNSASNSPANSEDEDEETKSKKSLEKRSKNSRARVHYHKFTRGKDLSNYKEDDLACILGSKRSKKKDPIEVVEPKEELIVKDVFGDEVGTTKKEHGVVTIAAGNYQEYFAKKMAALKKQREGNANNVKVEVKEEVKEESAFTTTEDSSLETRKSKKKKKKDKDQLEASINDSYVDQTKENLNSTNDSMEKKSKKKNRKSEDSNSNMLVEADIKEEDSPLFGFGFSCGFTNGATIKRYPINKHNVFVCEDEKSKDEKNMKKNISRDDLCKQNSSEKINKNKNDESLNESVEIKEKKKKKKSKDVSYEMEDTTVISKNENSKNSFEEVKKKKKKRCKNKNAEKNSIVIENENAAEFSQKEKVKKKKNTEETPTIECLTENSELKKKKKKKNKEKMEDDSLIIEDGFSKSNENENVDLKEKRKGKKRKREEVEDDNDSSKSKKSKKNADETSQKASPGEGKNKLKRQEYWKKRTEEIEKYHQDKKAKRAKKHSKKKAHLNPEEKSTLAKKVLTAFEGAKVPNIMSKRDKMKLELSRVP